MREHRQTVHVLKEVYIGEASVLITTALVVFFFTVSLLLSSYRMQLFGQCEQKGVGLKTHSMNLFFPHRIFANSLETAAKLVFPLFVQLSAFTLSICILWSSL